MVTDQLDFRCALGAHGPAGAAPAVCSCSCNPRVSSEQRRQNAGVYS